MIKANKYEEQEVPKGSDINATLDTFQGEFG